MTNPLTPELICTDAAASARFYCDTLGFRVRFDRPSEGFFFLEREGATIMLVRMSRESWLAAPAVPPFGRGMHLEIMVHDARALLGRCIADGAPLFRPIEEAWYHTDTGYAGQVQFIVADPDGYLLRFAQDLGKRDMRPETGRVVE